MYNSLRFQIEVSNTTEDIIIISEEIISHTVEIEDNQGASGGDIIYVANLLAQLLIKQAAVTTPKHGCNESRIITDNILSTTDYLFNSTIGWNEISNDASRYESSSNLLDVSDFSGYSFLNLSKDFGSSSMEDCHTYRFDGLVLTMQSSNFNKTTRTNSTNICHIFGASKICVPVSAIQSVDENEILQVAVQHKIDTSANIFPSSLESLEHFRKIRFMNEYDASEANSTLNEFLVGLAINANIRIDTLPDEPIEIIFSHKSTKLKYKNHNIFSK